MGGFSYPDEYYYNAGGIPEGMGAGVLGAFFAIYVLVILACFAFALVTYVLHSAGLHTVANRRGIRHGWLAWLPIGKLWVLGSISDQYQYVVKGKIKNRRRQLLLLQVGLIALYIVWFLCFLATMISGRAVPGFLLCLLAIAVFPVIQTVLQYMAYYDLYRSCEPESSVLYLILSILFSVTLPFFVFFCRKKDNGMPMRKQIHQEPVAEADFAGPEDFEEE